MINKQFEQSTTRMSKPENRRRKIILGNFSLFFFCFLYKGLYSIVITAFPYVAFIVCDSLA